MRLGGCLAMLGVGQSAMALEEQPNGADAVTPVTPVLEASSNPAASGLAPCPQTVEFVASCTIFFEATLPTVSPVTPETLALEPEVVTPALDLDPAVIEGSPTLQRWLNEVPDVANEIRHQPSFRTRLRVGYAQFPSTGQIGGFGAAVEDVFVPGTGLTASVDYSRSWNGDRESYGGEARYYLLPLGGYFNIAPTVGYRSLSTPAYQIDGLDVGLRLMLVPSRGGGADLALSQRWVAPGSENEVGITSLAIGYAVTRQLRLGTDFQRQNSRFGQDSRVGVSLELLL
ncbi:MAG: hypothetical protein DCF32_09735 [Leptolyngbya sp.]|nr:MAG: hypothetical protein DCF32_09735 [Leptolyngbya sp.]